MPEVQQANGGGYRSSSSSAERVRRYRLRQRQGRLVVSVEIEQADIDVLVHREYSSQANRGDPAAILFLSNYVARLRLAYGCDAVTHNPKRCEAPSHRSPWIAA
jgi:hypothetical protein